MEEASPAFPANFVSLKDLQEKWIKRKEEEENEEKLRRFREEEEIKARNEKEALNHQLKSKRPTRSARKSPSPSDPPAAHPRGRERKEKNLAGGFDADERKGKKAIGAESETSTAAAGRKRSTKRASRRSRMPPSESESAVEIADKGEEKEGKGLKSSRGDPMADIRRKVADLSIAGDRNRRGGRSSRGGGYGGRRGGGAATVSASGAGMVWVRKTEC